MKKGTTKTGFEFNLPDDILDNMELVDLLVDTRDDPIMISKVLDTLFDNETKKRLYDHVRNKNGHVPVGAVTDEIKDIFNAFGEDGKKS